MCTKFQVKKVKSEKKRVKASCKQAGEKNFYFFNTFSNNKKILHFEFGKKAGAGKKFIKY